MVCATANKEITKRASAGGGAEMCVVCKCHEAMSHTSVSDCPALLSGPKEKQQLSLSPKLAKKERKIKAYFESRLFVCHLSYSFGHNKWPSSWTLALRASTFFFLAPGYRPTPDNAEEGHREMHNHTNSCLVFWFSLPC